MTRKKNQALSVLRELWSSDRQSRQLDLEVLGQSITRLPPDYWKENMFFKGARDTVLRELTNDFPKVVKNTASTHPVFVTKIFPGIKIRLCPCTSRPSPVRYIPRGTRLETTGVVVDRDSYLLEDYYFNLPLDPEFSRGLNYQGTVPETSIRRRT
ncbi:MAG: hypothetical protein K9K79_01585 [Desulfohalobiaceae bacterium]|nr:hypothetical protein [Desulfohalobiaceae bacterium]